MEKNNKGNKVLEALYNINTKEIQKASSEFMTVLVDSIKNAAGSDKMVELKNNSSLQTMSAALSVLGVEPNKNQKIAASILAQNFRNAGEMERSQMNGSVSVTREQVIDSSRQKSEAIAKFNDEHVKVKADDQIMKAVNGDIDAIASKLANHKKLSEIVEERVQSQPKSVKSTMLGVGKGQEAQHGISN